jgi:hypothetical protein
MVVTKLQNKKHEKDEQVQRSSKGRRKTYRRHGDGNFMSVMSMTDRVPDCSRASRCSTQYSSSSPPPFFLAEPTLDLAGRKSL